MLADGKKTVKATEFVKRQSKDSCFSYPLVDWETVEKWTEQNIRNFSKGYRSGVIIVHLPQELAHNFKCSVIKSKDAIEFMEFRDKRREGEDEFSRKVALVESKPLAKYCDVVLYHKDVLAEDPLNDIEELGLWNIVSINAREVKDQYPIPPLTMSRNHLVKTGGTLAEYTANEFAESIWFWSQHSLSIEI